jgi:molybdate transport system ATP-binding protein
LTLEAAVKLTLGPLRVDVELGVGLNDVVAIVGPNGAGKTTLLRAIAGLVPLVEGRVLIDGMVVEDTRRGIRLPPEQRNIGVVFQEHRLFPNLSALENVAFGLRAAGTAKVAARARAQEWLERVGVPEIARSRPRHLSGGQAQRVALARALVTEPAVLLLDEPLASVDAAARAELRHLLRSELARYPGARLVVTHDPVEAASLANRLVVVENGTITQEGPLVEVTARPRSPWVASMVGLNLLTGRARNTTVILDNDAAVATAAPYDGPVFVAIRPNAVTLHRSRPESSARNVWPGEVSELYPAGDRARVRIRGPVPLIAEVTAASVAELQLAGGGTIWASVKATDIETYPN